MRRLLQLAGALPLLLPGAAAQGLDLPPPTASASPIDISPAQAQAVERGLAWLASEQNSDGSWTASERVPRCCLSHV